MFRAKYLLVAILLFAITAHGQVSIDLNASKYDSKSIIRSNAGNNSFKIYESVRPFTLNEDLKQINFLSENTQIVLDLFPGHQYTGIISNISTDINSTLILAIIIDDFPLSYGFISTDSRGISFLRIHMPELNSSFEMYYRIETGRSFLAHIDNENQSAFVDGVSIFQNDDNFERRIDFGNVARGSNEVTTIDVMVVYTYNAEMWYDHWGGINNGLASMIADMNTIFGNSDTGVIFNLVFSGPVDFWETNNSSDDLIALRNPSDGIMNEVHFWRETHRADIVTLITDNFDTLGIGPLLRNLPGNPISGFNIVNTNGMALGTYPKVYGQAFGCHNHKENEYSPGPGIFDYSAGWRFQASRLYATYMCNTTGWPDHQTSSRIPYFSNPNIFYDSKSIGDTEHGDNARTIRETKHYVAAYSDLLNTPDAVAINISFSPNPVTDKLNITTSEPLTAVKLFDQQGRLLYEDSTSQINFQSYSEGVYFVYIETSEGRLTKKIIKH